MGDDFGNMMGDPTISDFPDQGFDPGAGPMDIGSLGGLMPAGLFSSPGRAAIAGATGAVGRALGRGYGAIIVAGRSVSVKKVWEIAKKFGLEFLPPPGA